MRIRRKFPVIVAVIAVAVAVVFLVFLHKHAPPEPARLLPGADGFLYVNLQWLRRADVAANLPSVPHDPEYEQFIQATGFQFERDLDQAAFAIHYPQGGPKQNATPEQPRFSEVFVGHIDGERLTAYLRKLASSVDNYRSVDIYNIPIEGRIVRVAILGVDTVAVSNHNDPQVIRGIVDRSRKLASPFGGPSFLRQYYKDVPFASLAWTIFKVRPNSESLPVPLEMSFLFPKPAVLVGSVRYLGKIHFRAEAFTGSDEQAQQVTDKVSTFLSLFHSAEVSVAPGPADPDMKQFLDSLKVERHGARAVLTTIVPTALIRKVLAESPAELAPAPAPEPQPVPAPRKKQKK